MKTQVLSHIHPLVLCESSLYPCSTIDWPRIAFVAIFAIGIFVILLKNGTVRLERGLTSITYTSSSEMTY